MDALIEATAQLLVSEGYASLTTNGVAARAGVSVGTLYRYFDDKEALISALVDKLAEERIAAFLGSLAEVVGEEDDLELGAKRLVRATIGSQSVRPELTRTLMLEAPSDGLVTMQRAWRSRVAEVVATVFRSRPERVRSGDHALMAHVLVTAVHAVLSDAQANSPHWMSDPALETELTALVVAYLRP